MNKNKQNYLKFNKIKLIKFMADKYEQQDKLDVLRKINRNPKTSQRDLTKTSLDLV